MATFFFRRGVSIVRSTAPLVWRPSGLRLASEPPLFGLSLVGEALSRRA
jgi:hypothetical protein